MVKRASELAGWVSTVYSMYVALLCGFSVAHNIWSFMSTMIRELIVGWYSADRGNTWSVALPLHCMAGLPCSRVADCFSRFPVCNSTGASAERPWSTSCYSLQCGNWSLGHDLPGWHLPSAGLLCYYMLLTLHDILPYEFLKRRLSSVYMLINITRKLCRLTLFTCHFG